MHDEQKAKIQEVLKSNNYCVVATATDSGAPESAVVAYSETPELEIIFASFSDTRKNANIAKNPAVSLVVGLDHTKPFMLQIEGVAVRVEGDERLRCAEIQCAKNPGSELYARDEREEYFKVTPHWVRFVDQTNEPPQSWEVAL